MLSVRMMRLYVTVRRFWALERKPPLFCGLWTSCPEFLICRRSWMVGKPLSSCPTPSSLRLSAQISINCRSQELDAEARKVLGALDHLVAKGRVSVEPHLKSTWIKLNEVVKCWGELESRGRSSQAMPFEANTVIDFGPIFSIWRKIVGESSHALPLTVWHSSRAARAAPPYFLWQATAKMARAMRGAALKMVSCVCKGEVFSVLVANSSKLTLPKATWSRRKTLSAYVLAWSRLKRISELMRSLLKSWGQLSFSDI